MVIYVFGLLRQISFFRFEEMKPLFALVSFTVLYLRYFLHVKISIHKLHKFALVYFFHMNCNVLCVH